MKTFAIPFIAVLILIFSGTAFAAGIAIPGGPTALDGTVTINADVTSPPDPSTYETSIVTSLEPNRSYACTILGDRKTVDLDITGLTDPSLNQVLLKPIGDVTPAVTGDSGDTNNNRISIIPSGTGTQVAGGYTLEVANNTASSGTSVSAKARVDCVETTLYGGYNTNVNDFNFLEITNTTNSTISGSITATNSDGTVVINKQPFSVQSNRRADVDIHTPAGANKFGLIQIVHNGPYGALQAYVSQYDGNISNFVLTASIPLRPRDK